MPSPYFNLFILYKFLCMCIYFILFYSIFHLCIMDLARVFLFVVLLCFACFVLFCSLWILLQFSEWGNSFRFSPVTSFQTVLSFLLSLVISLDCCLCCCSGSFGRRQDDALSSTSSTTTTTTSTSSVTSPTGPRSLLSRYQHTQEIEHPNETPRVRSVSKLCRCVTGIGQKRVRKRRRRKSRPRSSPQSTLQPPPLPPPLLELY